MVKKGLKKKADEPVCQKKQKDCHDLLIVLSGNLAAQRLIPALENNTIPGFEDTHYSKRRRKGVQKTGKCLTQSGNLFVNFFWE